MTHEDIAAEVCRTVAELPDRNSPEDWPEAMLVTADELRSIVMAALSTNAGEAAPAATMPTDEQIIAVWNAWPRQSISSRAKAVEFFRAVVAAHPPAAVHGQSASTEGAVAKCPDCEGSGVDGDVDDYGHTIDVQCGRCGGSGKMRDAGLPWPWKTEQEVFLDAVTYLQHQPRLAGAMRIIAARATPKAALTDAELGTAAYKGYDDYWAEDSKGIEAEAWAASAKAVLTLATPPAAIPAAPMTVDQMTVDRILAIKSELIRQGNDTAVAFARAIEAETTIAQPDVDANLDFEPDEQHSVADMANIGYALMQALPKGYAYNDSPVEIVADLQNEIADLKATPVQQEAAGDALKAARDEGFDAGTVAALAILRAHDSETQWFEVLQGAGEARVLYHAAHVEPDAWKWAGFAQYKLSKPKKRAALQPTQGAKGGA